MASRSRFAAYVRAQVNDARAGWLSARLVAHVMISAVVAITAFLLVERLGIAAVTAKSIEPPTALPEPVPVAITQPEPVPFDGCIRAR